MSINRTDFSRRTLLGAAAATPLLGASLAACSSDEGVPEGKKELVLATSKFQSTITVQDYADQFNNSQDTYHVTVRELPPTAQSTELHQQLVQTLSRQDGSIDIFAQDVIWVAEFASAGWALPLEKEFGSEERSVYFDGILDACTYDGQLVALPFFIDAGQLFYRSDLLADNGMDVPTTWGQLAEYAVELTEGGQVENGFLWQGKQAEAMICNLVEFIASNNGSILGPDGKTVTIADKEAVEAVQFMYDTMNDLAISPKALLSWDEEPSRKPFTNGDGAFLRQWSYIAPVAADAEQSNIVDKFGVAPLPAFDGGTSSACLGGHQLGINASSENIDGALEFLEWTRSFEAQEFYAINFGSSPARKDVYSSETLAEEQPFMIPLMEVFEGGTPRPVTPKYSQVSLALQSTVSTALSTGAIEEGLTAAKSQIEEIIA